MGTTLYIALEQLIDMSNPSDWKLDHQLQRSLISHGGKCRFIGVFAPYRFGLIFETRDEAAEAWAFIRNWLLRRGLEFEARCVVLQSDGDTTDFGQIPANSMWLANQADRAADLPNVRFLSELPAERLGITARLRRLLLASIFHG